MKTFTLLYLLLLANIIDAEIPEIVLSKSIKLYIESKETENLGYGNWNPYEDGEYLIIKNFIQKNHVVIDAGAHVGEWSDLVLKHTKNTCRLYCFEPIPDFFEKLKNNLNNRAECFNQALGNIEKDVLMNYYYIESEGCSSIFDRKVLSSIPVKKISVSVACLDKFCKEKNINHIHFLKIDTEGSELNVLLGADDLITNKKIDIIQFEYGGTYPDANITLHEVYSYLTSKGYTIFRLTADGLIHIPVWKEELENFKLSNYLAVLN
jgi:FkbM family methyltransferase